MRYSDLLHEKIQKNEKIDEVEPKELPVLEDSKAEDVLRAAGYKIKMVTPTSFGIQIDLAKKYEDEELEDILTDFTIKIKNKSVFIVL
jgi:hypothetical protein